jgi:hypothetical protein
MKPTVYIETSIVSYLTARKSRDIIIAAHQKLTREWWKSKRRSFDCYGSEAVIREATAGDAREAKRRLKRLNEVRVLEATAEARELAQLFLTRKVVPLKAAEDAAHIAIATVNGMDFILTWNCKHIANARLVARLAEVCGSVGYELPIICTPEELMGE